MQALRHASRRALRATVIVQEPSFASARACSSAAGGRVTVRLNKEERFQVASQFIEKYKAANNGQLPTASLMRKEVGGKYDVLKEVLQEFEKGSSEQVATGGTADIQKSKTQKPAVTKQDQQGAEGVTKKSAAVAKDRRTKKPSSKEDSRVEGAATVQDQHGAEEDTKDSTETVKDGHKKQSFSKKEKESTKDKKVTPQVQKSLEERKSVEQVDALSTSEYTKKQKQSFVPTEEPLELLVDTLATDEDDDDDSDVAAPEYQKSSLMQMKEGVPQARDNNSKIGTLVHSKDEVKRQDDDQAIKSKLQPKEEDSKIETAQKGLGALKSVIQSMADKRTKQPSVEGSAGSGRPPTTVLRIVNLPAHITANHLRSVCESVARVHGVNLRRGRIADVQFNVDIREMPSVLERLRKVSIGSSSLKVFPALRFSCESNMSSRFKPWDVSQFKYVRNSLIHAFEQRFKFLCFQFQDYRDLHNLKVAK